MTDKTRIEKRRLDHGCAILYEMVAEAFDPEWRELVGRIYAAMRDADLTRDMSKPWRPPSQPSGGQCVAIDENGDACCAFHDHRTGKWYLCSNIVDPDLEFQPRCWTPLQVMSDKPKPSAIDIIDEILRPLLGSFKATSVALDIFYALRRAELLHDCPPERAKPD